MRNSSSSPVTFTITDNNSWQPGVAYTVPANSTVSQAFPRHLLRRLVQSRYHCQQRQPLPPYLRRARRDLAILSGTPQSNVTKIGNVWVIMMSNRNPRLRHRHTSGGSALLSRKRGGTLHQQPDHPGKPECRTGLMGLLLSQRAGDPFGRWNRHPSVRPQLRLDGIRQQPRSQ